MSIVKTADGGFELFKAAIQTLKSAQSFNKGSSLIEVAQVARVEPLVILDRDVQHLEYISDVMQTVQSIFSGYYLQAASLLGTTIDGVSVAKKLEPLNPRGSKIDWWIATEEFEYRLPKSSHKNLPISLEKRGKDSGGGIDGIDDMQECINLAVGKIYNVSIRNNDSTAVVPVSIRLLPNLVSGSSIAEMFTFKNSFDTSLKERYHSWRSGRISLFGDLIMCNDLIDAHRKQLLNDKTDVYTQISERNNTSKVNGILNKSPSLAVASNIAVISTKTVSLIEQKLAGKIKDFKTRKTIFDNSYLMMLVVVDSQWEQVEFYYRGMKEVSSLSVKNIRSSNKGKDATADIIKAFLQGGSPVI